MRCTGPPRSTWGGISFGLMFTLLYVWMGYSMTSAAGGEEGWEAQAHKRELELSTNLNVSSKVSHNPRCWIFVHLQKSGGSTIKKILIKRWRTTLRVYDSLHWVRGDQVAHHAAGNMVLGEPYKVAAGGYTEAFRSVVGKSCKWFAIFRHPISRLVSAYFYCKVKAGDPLCASMVVDTETLSLEEFAEHWGNFGLRQFVLGMVSIDAVNRFYKRHRTAENKGASGWYRLKMFLNHEGDPTGGNENTIMAKAVPRIRKLIHEEMDAVGLLEDFPTTLTLLNHALEMPGLNWTTSFEHFGIFQKQQEYRSQEKAVLQDAWNNSAIKNHISLDLLLYEDAVQAFNEKVEQFGLK